MVDLAQKAREERERKQQRIKRLTIASALFCLLLAVLFAIGLRLILRVETCTDACTPLLALGGAVEYQPTGGDISDPLSAISISTSKQEERINPFKMQVAISVPKALVPVLFSEPKRPTLTLVSIVALLALVGLALIPCYLVYWCLSEPTMSVVELALELEVAKKEGGNGVKTEAKAKKTEINTEQKGGKSVIKTEPGKQKGGKGEIKTESGVKKEPNLEYEIKRLTRALQVCEIAHKNTEAEYATELGKLAKSLAAAESELEMEKKLNKELKDKTFLRTPEPTVKLDPGFINSGVKIRRKEHVIVCQSTLKKSGFEGKTVHIYEQCSHLARKTKSPIQWKYCPRTELGSITVCKQCKIWHEAHSKLMPTPSGDNKSLANTKKTLHFTEDDCKHDDKA